MTLTFVQGISQRPRSRSGRPLTSASASASDPVAFFFFYFLLLFWNFSLFWKLFLIHSSATVGSFKGSVGRAFILISFVYSAAGQDKRKLGNIPLTRENPSRSFRCSTRDSACYRTNILWHGLRTGRRRFVVSDGVGSWLTSSSKLPLFLYCVFESASMYHWLTGTQSEKKTTANLNYFQQLIKSGTDWLTIKSTVRARAFACHTRFLTSEFQIVFLNLFCFFSVTHSWPVMIRYSV